MKPSPHLLRFSGDAFQKCVWPSTMKYCSPSFSYIGVPSPRWLLHRLEVEADVLGGVLRVGEQQHSVVEDDHTPIVGAHDLLEVIVAEVVPAQRLRDLLVVEVDLVRAVDPDHRRQVGDRDALLGAHDVCDDVADLVVHQRDARHVRRAAIRGTEATHALTSFGVSSPISSAMTCRRPRERSRESSKRTTFSETCDQMGWSWRAALIAAGAHSSNQPCMIVPFCVPLLSSLASIRNRARAPRCSRAASDSPAPMIVGVTKSPWRAATCITKPERNSSPMSGSNTTAVANHCSAQSRVPVRRSTNSRVGCQTGSSCHVCLWTEPLKPSISSDSVRL